MIRYIAPLDRMAAGSIVEPEPARSLLQALITVSEATAEQCSAEQLEDRLRNLPPGDVAVISARFLDAVGIPTWLAKVPAWAETRLLVSSTIDGTNPNVRAWASTVDEIVAVGGRIEPWPDAIQVKHVRSSGLAGVQELRQACTRPLQGMRLPAVQSLARCDLPTEYGTFEVTAYSVDGQENALLIAMGDLRGGDPPLIRVHSECFTGEVLSSLKCDCDAQLQAGMKAIAERGRGAIVYLRQEGRGIGLANKIAAYSEQQRGADTIEANRRLGFPADLRDFTSAALILRMHGVESVEVLTNNPMKVRTLRRFGIGVHHVSHMLVEPNQHNARYLQVKYEALGHIGLGAVLPQATRVLPEGAELMVFDLDGVVQFGREVPKAAIELIDRARAAGHEVRFLTNDGYNSRESRMQQLRHAGLRVDRDEIYTSSYLAARYIQAGTPVLALAGSPGCDELAHLPRAGSDAKIVIVGDWFEHYDRKQLQEAFTALQNGAELIAMHRKRHWQNSNGQLIDVGFWVAGLEYCTKRPATVVGKPSPFAYETLRQDLGYPTNRIVMISDETDPDLNGAKRLGWRTILFGSAKAEQGHQSAPDYATLTELLLSRGPHCATA
jgi:GTP cyclohydrolase II